MSKPVQLVSPFGSELETPVDVEKQSLELSIRDHMTILDSYQTMLRDVQNEREKLKEEIIAAHSEFSRVQDGPRKDIDELSNIVNSKSKEKYKLDVYIPQIEKRITDTRTTIKKLEDDLTKLEYRRNTVELDRTGSLDRDSMSIIRSFIGMEDMTKAKLGPLSIRERERLNADENALKAEKKIMERVTRVLIEINDSEEVNIFNALNQRLEGVTNQKRFCAMIVKKAIEHERSVDVSAPLNETRMTICYFLVWIILMFYDSMGVEKIKSVGPTFQSKLANAILDDRETYLVVDELIRWSIESHTWPPPYIPRTYIVLGDYCKKLIGLYSLDTLVRYSRERLLLHQRYKEDVDPIGVQFCSETCSDFKEYLKKFAFARNDLKRRENNNLNSASRQTDTDFILKSLRFDDVHVWEKIPIAVRSRIHDAVTSEIQLYVDNKTPIENYRQIVQQLEEKARSDFLRPVHDNDATVSRNRIDISALPIAVDFLDHVFKIEQHWFDR